jgi:hypothetical protein
MAKAVQYSETDAMKDLEQALDRIDENARRRVLGWAFSKYGLGAPGGTITPVSSPVLTQASQSRDIKVFTNGKKPGNGYERVACLAYFLEKIDKMEKIKTADITKANTDARLSKLTNTAVYVSDAIRKYGYLTPIGHGVVGLSARGEAMVDALPDREKVKEALESNPFRRSGKKKKAGKK